MLPFKTHLLIVWAKWPWVVSDGSYIISCTVGLLDAFTKLWKATVSIIILMSVCPHETTWFPLYRFSWNLMFEDFSKTCGKKKSSILNLTRIMGTLHENIQIFVIISLWILLRMRNVPDKGCRGNQNTNFVFNNFCLWKTCHLRDNVEKYGSAGQATDDNIIIVHVLCVLEY